MYLQDVVSLTHDPARCNGCGACLEVCPQGVLVASGDTERARVRIGERDACMECGACALNCPTGAVRVASGTGCAAAVINAALGRTSSACCCSIDDGDSSAGGCG